VVDYATASLSVASTCPQWSLRLVPIADPGLPHTLERFTVRGASIIELAPQPSTSGSVGGVRALACQVAVLTGAGASCRSATNVSLAADIIYPAGASDQADRPWSPLGCWCA
jgi:hypothetical protein